MENNTQITSCGSCGRSFPTAVPSGCTYWDGCGCENHHKKLACIKQKQPDCEATAVIPSITVETADGITNLANCFVHVTNINTTFYVDSKHRIMLVWAGPVETSNYDVNTNPLGLRSQFCIDSGDDYTQLLYYDKQGNAHNFGMGV